MDQEAVDRIEDRAQEIKSVYELEKSLGYKFKNILLLEEALNHSSFVNEQADLLLKDNERFEFLGDAVLNLVTSHLLMEEYPPLNEGSLSQMRASLVNEFQLADIAYKMELGCYIRLGRGEMHTKGQEKKSILANALEAVIAAIYLDGGFAAAFDFVKRHFSKLIKTVTAVVSNHDYKSRIQEFSQAVLKSTPVYTLVDQIGPDHDKIFKVRVEIKGFFAEGTGKSKKKAEQDAAYNALKDLLQDEF